MKPIITLLSICLFYLPVLSQQHFVNGHPAPLNPKNPIAVEFKKEHFGFVGNVDSVVQKDNTWSKEENFYICWRFDKNGFIIRHLAAIPYGGLTTYGYSINPNGMSSTSKYSIGGEDSRIFTSYNMDAGWQPLSASSTVVKAKYSYTNNRLTEKIQKDRTEDYNGEFQESTSVTRHRYNQAGQLTETVITTEENRSVWYRYQYNAKGQLSVKSTNETANAETKTTYTYQQENEKLVVNYIVESTGAQQRKGQHIFIFADNGRLLSRTDMEGTWITTTNWTYDAFGNWIKKTIEGKDLKNNNVSTSFEVREIKYH